MSGSIDSESDACGNDWDESWKPPSSSGNLYSLIFYMYVNNSISRPLSEGAAFSLVKEISCIYLDEKHTYCQLLILFCFMVNLIFS